MCGIMVFEDFKKQAENTRPYVGDAFYRLDVFYMTGRSSVEVCKYPMFDVWLSHSSFHYSLSESEIALGNIVNGKHSDGIYCAYVYKLPLGKNVSHGQFAEAFAYDGGGQLVDRSYCSNLDEDYDKDHSVFRGRKGDAIRFDEENFVEVFDAYCLKVRLAIVLHKVPSVEICWKRYLKMKERVETDWKMPYDGMVGHLDFTDDSYVVIDCEGHEKDYIECHSHANSIYMFKPRFQIPHELKGPLLEDYRANLEK